MFWNYLIWCLWLKCHKQDGKKQSANLTRCWIHMCLTGLTNWISEGWCYWLRSLSQRVSRGLSQPFWGSNQGADKRVSMQIFCSLCAEGVQTNWRRESSDTSDKLNHLKKKISTYETSLKIENILKLLTLELKRWNSFQILKQRSFSSQNTHRSKHCSSLVACLVLCWAQTCRRKS